ncbi:MAG: DsbA family protein [Myxococcaceae bacterium]
MSTPLPISARDHVQGPPDAALTLLEYGDYQCPHCGVAHPIVKQVQRELGRDLRFVFRNFPLVEVHPRALPAALAAAASGFQNAFWPMHDTLFEHQNALEDSDLLAYAEALELEQERFLKDVNSRIVRQRIAVDIESGTLAGVPGTPAFFINGELHRGPWDHESLLSVLVTRLTGGESAAAP